LQVEVTSERQSTCRGDDPSAWSYVSIAPAPTPLQRQTANALSFAHDGVALNDGTRSARQAGLRWVDPGEPGIARVRQGDAFAYRTAAGRVLRDNATLSRIRKIAIPPAWQDVWICADARGHIQATGRDARGRKQYRYHTDWQVQRGQTKFEHLLEFGRALPRIRARVHAALGDAQGPPTRERVLATLVRLLDTTRLRVGNAEYARDNASFGLSTLRNRHADVRGATLTLSFKGKSGVRHEARLEDRRVARVVQRCRELPGQALFQYVDDEAKPRRMDSTDINAWLAEAAESAVTAKDFRTWHGSVRALQLAQEADASMTSVLAGVSRALGNTPAVCRKAYVHPAVLDTIGAAPARAASTARASRGLRADEQRLLRLLRSLERKHIDRAPC
jgi:DNA topoisomerase I